MILSALAVLLTFGMVIFLHEFGHFLVCKKFKVRVEKFAFGFGSREVWGFTWGETRYSIYPFPLGGFVKPAGENLEDFSGKPDEYFSQPWYKRILIVAAGPGMNYVLAFVLFSAIVYFRGIPQSSPLPIVGDIMEGFPAQAAGLVAGDRIRSVSGRPVETWTEMAEIIHVSANRKVELTVEREGKIRTLRIVPRLDSASGRGLIGIAAQVQFEPVGLFRALKTGAHQCWFWTAHSLQTLWTKLIRRERPDLAGPVGIVQMVSRAAHSGFEDLIALIALISVAVGLFNLFPIPLLDGGHAMLYLWEGLSRRRPTQAVMAVLNGAGIVFLLSLLLFATYGDVMRIRDSRRDQASGVSP